MTEPVLELQKVTKSYPGCPPVVALADVSLAIRAGERVAIVGPSGSGKTTLLQLLGTLERPTAGVVRCRGQDVSYLPDAALSAVRAHRLGFVFQQFQLVEHLDAVANVALGLLYRGIPPARRRAAATDALGRVGLGHRAAHRPGQLSGGERQRLAIARAICGRPAVILADEPTGNLDSATGAQIIALLAGLAGDRAALVVVTHNPDVAAVMSRRLTMRDGRVTSDGPTSARPVTS